MINCCATKHEPATTRVTNRRHMTFTLVAVALCVTLTSCRQPAAAQELLQWPQWRGPNGTSVLPERDVPLSWGPGENVRWKVPVSGFGASTPAVWEDHVFLTTQVGDTLRVLCLDRQDGKVRWDHEVGVGQVVREAPKGATKFHKLHNMASPSPVTDGERVFFHFGNGQLLCFDFAGKQVWQRNLTDDYGHYTIWWGHANSPVLYEDLIISVCMQDPVSEAKSYLVAHDKQTGKLVWYTERDTGAQSESADSYTTPLLSVRDGRDELVVMGGNAVDAYDPKTGKQLWKRTGLDGGRTITGPALGESLIFVTHGMRGPLVAIDPGKTDAHGSAKIAWSQTGSTPDTSCPIVVNGLLMTVTDNGIANCYDSATGKFYWRERLGGDFKSSPIAIGNRVYFLNRDGVTYVIEASQQFQQLAKNELGEPAIASLAVAGNELFLRTEQHLWCIAK